MRVATQVKTILIGKNNKYPVAKPQCQIAAKNILRTGIKTDISVFRMNIRHFQQPKFISHKPFQPKCCGCLTSKPSFQSQSSLQVHYIQFILFYSNCKPIPEIKTDLSG